MKNLKLTYLTSALVLLFALPACTDSIKQDSSIAVGTHDLNIVAHPKGFDEKNVTTRSLKNDYESLVTNMAMFVFDSDGAVVDYQFVEGNKPLFTIDRDDENGPYYSHTQSKLQNSTIYILANVVRTGSLASVFGESTTSITNVSELLALSAPVEGIGRPEIGFPMFGNRNALDLRRKAQSTLATGAVVDITLTCLYAKVVFNISVVPEQTSDVIQKFTLDSWTVYNVPNAVKLSVPGATEQTAHAASIIAASHTDGYGSSSYTGANPTQQGSGQPLSFSFYMPEHKVNPDSKASNYNGYPWGHDSQFDSYRQHYKPLLLGAKSGYATYVEIKGHYIDHNNRDREVTYRVYLGEDNYENFYINRDTQLNNNITIKGVTNSSNLNESTVSFDHRVDIQQTEFRFELERETLLDSHWEIRPIRITLDANEHPNAKIQVEVMNANSVKWIRMEMPSTPTGDAYCNVQQPTNLAYGKRRYFTTDLVTNTLKNNTTYTITADPNKAEHVIWVYIDENTTLPSQDGSTTRDATVQCRYYDQGNTSSTPDVMEDYLFRQRSLHRITRNGHTYYIEYFEEYLYNFDSREGYGTTDGMAWGLDGIQLSKRFNAISMGAPTLKKNGLAYILTAIFSTIETNINNAVNNAVRNIANNYNAKYDFYLTRDGISGVTVRNYQGLHFTREIFKTAGIGVLATNDTPQSAIEYCVNKNKRNNDGTIDTINIRWFLPSIDQIEEITMGGYSDFDVFQNKFYWSSQPSYKGIGINYSVTCYNSDLKWAQVDGTATGSYYKDNLSRARATKVEHTGSDYTNASSGTTSTYGTLSVSHEGIYDAMPNPTYILSQEKADDQFCQEGNMSRNAINRIRCVYAPPSN